MLNDILIKTTEQKILSLFVANPDKAFYGREISKKLKISLGATSNALGVLKKKNILISEKKGKTNLYTLRLPNTYIEYFKTLNSLLSLEPLIGKLKNISNQIILYGSYASGNFTYDSDVDLFIVSEKREEVLKIIEEFTTDHALNIQPVIKKQVEWMHLDKQDLEFSNELSNGITLWEKPINESSF